MTTQPERPSPSPTRDIRRSITLQSLALRIVLAMFVCSVAITAVTAGRAQEVDDTEPTVVASDVDVDATPVVFDATETVIYVEPDATSVVVDGTQEADHEPPVGSTAINTPAIVDGDDGDGSSYGSNPDPNQGTPEPGVDGDGVFANLILPPIVVPAIPAAPPANNGLPPIVAAGIGAGLAIALGPNGLTTSNMTFPAGKNGIGEITGTFDTGALKGCTYKGTVRFDTFNGKFRIYSDNKFGNITVTCPGGKGTFDMQIVFNYPAVKQQKPGDFQVGTIVTVPNSGTGAFAGLPLTNIPVKTTIVTNAAGGQTVQFSFGPFPPKKK